MRNFVIRNLATRAISRRNSKNVTALTSSNREQPVLSVKNRNFEYQIFAFPQDERLLEVTRTEFGTKGPKRKRWLPNRAKNVSGLSIVEQATALVVDRISEFLSKLSSENALDVNLSHWPRQYSQLPCDLYFLQDTTGQSRPEAVFMTGKSMEQEENTSLAYDDNIKVYKSGTGGREEVEEDLPEVLFSYGVKGYRVTSSTIKFRDSDQGFSQFQDPKGVALLQYLPSDGRLETTLVKMDRNRTLVKHVVSGESETELVKNNDMNANAMYFLDEIQSRLTSNLDQHLLYMKLSKDSISSPATDEQYVHPSDIHTVKLCVKFIEQEGESSDSANFVTLRAIKHELLCAGDHWVLDRLGIPSGRLELTCPGINSLEASGKTGPKCAIEPTNEAIFTDSSQPTNEAILKNSAQPTNEAVQNHSTQPAKKANLNSNTQVTNQVVENAIERVRSMALSLVLDESLRTSVCYADESLKLEAFSLEMKKDNRRWQAWLSEGDLMFRSGVNKFVEHKRKYSEGKNNRTPFEQGMLEIAAKVRAKSREGYRLVHISDSKRLQEHSHLPISFSSRHEVSLAQTLDTAGLRSPRPMLSQTLHPEKACDRFSKSSIVFHQPKLDGIRCLANLRTGELWTRKGKPLLGLPHIEKAVLQVGKAVQGLATPVEWLDGEVYKHGLSFQKISSLARKSKGLTFQSANSNSGDLEAKDEVSEDELTLHVFDCISELPFQQRLQVLQGMSMDRIPWIELVNTTQVAVPKEDDVLELLKAVLENHMENGYEGTIWRIGVEDGYQVGKRSFSSLKYKSFDQEEFTCVSLMERQYSEGILGALQLSLPDGRTFNATPATSIDDKRSMWENKENYIALPGEEPQYLATVKFQGYSEQGIPRFPVVIGFRHVDDM